MGASTCVQDPWVLAQAVLTGPCCTAFPTHPFQGYRGSESAASGAAGAAPVAACSCAHKAGGGGRGDSVGSACYAVPANRSTHSRAIGLNSWCRRAHAPAEAKETAGGGATGAATLPVCACAVRLVEEAGGTPMRLECCCEASQVDGGWGTEDCAVAGTARAAFVVASPDAGGGSRRGAVDVHELM